MNQQLLNINTVISPNNNINSYSNINIERINITSDDDLNNPIRLEQITSIVNNSNASYSTNNANKQDTNLQPLRYKIIKYLGRGIHGNLYLALDAKGRRVICKEIQLDSKPSNNIMQTWQLEFELNILKYLSSNSIAREHVNPCIDYKIHQNHIYTIFPVFKGYSLGHFHSYMLKLAKKEASHNSYYKIAFFLIKSLLHALAKIHDTGIAHQNITQNSILVSTFIEPGEIKVKFTDFGLGCGCPKDQNGIQQYVVNNTMIPWQQYENINEFSKSNAAKIGNCKENGHVPVKYMNKVLTQLKDSDYLKISQKFDILCIGLIIIKFLLYFDTEILAIIDELLSRNMNMKMDVNKLQILREKIKAKYFSNHNPLLNILSISKDDKKLILEYLKLIWKYMICSTIKRKPAQYIIDKIIIYEKYKNDSF